MTRKCINFLLWMLVWMAGSGCHGSSSAPADPPLFGGLASASGVGDTTIQLGWLPASDAGVTSDQLTYLVYQSTASGQQDFTTPTVTTDPGVTTFIRLKQQDQL